MQGVEVASQIGFCLPDVKIASFIGGMPLAEDRVKAQRCHLAVGTPGRIKQVLSEGILNPDTVRLVILDEADKLLEQSFIQDTTHILNLLPKNKQVLALSATYPEELSNLAEKFMRSPQHIRLGKESQVLHGVAQFVMQLESSPSQPKQNQIKQLAILKILSSVPFTQCLVFSNYQLIAQSTADFLNSRGFPAIFISAGQDQMRRLQAIQTFKSNKCKILCSTDLTARGIDAENVNLVINLDVPEDPNTYLHRIGRGGRFGSNSIAITLAPEGKEMKRLQKIVTVTSSSIRVLPDILPKDIRGGEFPALEGLSPEELKEVEPTAEKTKKEGSEPVEGQPRNEAKKGNKIKRRGKKNKSSAPPSRANALQPKEVDLKPVEEDYFERLRELIKPKPVITRAVQSFEEICDIAKNKDYSSLLLNQPESNEPCEEDIKLLGRHFLKVSRDEKDKFDIMVKDAEQNLNHLSLTDLLEQVKLDYEPCKEPEKKIEVSVAEPDPSEESTISESESSSSGGDSFSSDSEGGSTPATDTNTALFSLPGAKETVPTRQKVPTVTSAPFTVASSGYPTRLTPQQALDLQRWIQNVERQRQIIQNREYWRMMSFHQKRS